jgi:glc operon protein GlcG
MERAQAAIQAAVAEANKRGWALNITVVDPNGDLVTFARMDGVQLASIAISQHKARAAARYRRPTHAFEDGVQKAGLHYLLTLDDVIASRGGIPLIEGGKLLVRSVAPAAPVLRTRWSAPQAPIRSTNNVGAVSRVAP